MTFEEILPVLKKGGKARLNIWKRAHCEIRDNIICIAKGGDYIFPMRLSSSIILSDQWVLLSNDDIANKKLRLKKMNNIYLNSSYLGDDLA